MPGWVEGIIVGSVAEIKPVFAALGTFQFDAQTSPHRCVNDHQNQVLRKAAIRDGSTLSSNYCRAQSLCTCSGESRLGGSGSGSRSATAIRRRSKSVM